MLEDPSEIDDVAAELRRTPLVRQSEGSLKLYLDQLKLAEGALKLIVDDAGGSQDSAEAKRQRSADLRGQIAAEIERRIAARDEAAAAAKPSGMPFTDDVARDRYAANGGNWASERRRRRSPDAQTYSTYALVWTALIALAIGALIRRR